MTEASSSAVTMDKVVPTANATVADIADSPSLAVGGFGVCGMPTR